MKVRFFRPPVLLMEIHMKNIVKSFEFSNALIYTDFSTNY